MNELWLPVVGYEGFYEVSNQGRVRSLDREVRHSSGTGTRLWRGRILKQIPSTNGYRQVGCCREGKQRMERVHRLACIAFHGPCPSSDHNVDHIDENKQNNRANNLRWMLAVDNTLRSVQTPLTEGQVRLIRKDRRTLRAVAAEYGVDPSTISLIRRGLRWAHVT